MARDMICLAIAKEASLVDYCAVADEELPLINEDELPLISTNLESSFTILT